MNVINEVADVLLLKRNKALEMHEQYEKEIAKLPKGTVQAHRSVRQTSYQLHYYCNVEKKSKKKYIPVKQLPLVRQQVERRQFLEKTLKESRKDLEVVDRMLRVANKRITQKSIGEPLENTNSHHNQQSTPLTSQQTLNQPKPPIK